MGGWGEEKWGTFNGHKVSGGKVRKFWISVAQKCKLFNTIELTVHLKVIKMVIMFLKSFGLLVMIIVI